MTKPGFLRRKSTYFVGVPLLILIAVIAGPFVYIHFIEGPAPKKLGFDSITTTTTKAKSSESTTSTTAAADVSSGSLDGTWKIADGSVVGYRVKEVLFGQSTTAVGRTSAITGNLAITATKVPSADFTVDLTKVKSDQSNRDNQFQSRIMNTSQFPTATFKLTSPITLSSVPKDKVPVTTSATGDLTLHGVTKSVTFDVTAQRDGDKVEVTGSIPVTFADYSIPNPTFGPATVGDNGTLEFALAFTKS
ncbi:MAG: YceI family protein [Actinomycetia bacterium]|nr:YceI family protein [Actinomycetes bacterium]